MSAAPAPAPVPAPAGTGLPGRTALVVAAVAAVPLGFMALVADTVPGDLGTALSVTASTGVAWGVGAIAMGAACRRPPAAAAAGVLIMAIAILTYYGGNAVWQIRPDGGSSYLVGKTGFWMAVALLAGPAAGLLGWRGTHGSRPGNSIAIGTAAGLVVVQGLYAWSPDRTYLYGSASGTRAWISALLIVLPVAVALWAARRRLPLLALATAAVVGIAGTAAWSAGQSLHLLRSW